MGTDIHLFVDVLVPRMPDAKLRELERAGSLAGYQWQFFVECGYDWSNWKDGPIPRTKEGVRLHGEGRSYAVFSAINGVRSGGSVKGFAHSGLPNGYCAPEEQLDWLHSKFWFYADELPLRFFKTYPECAWTWNDKLVTSKAADELLEMCWDLQKGFKRARIYGGYDS